MPVIRSREGLLEPVHHEPHPRHVSGARVSVRTIWPSFSWSAAPLSGAPGTTAWMSGLTSTVATPSRIAIAFSCAPLDDLRRVGPAPASSAVGPSSSSSSAWRATSVVSGALRVTRRRLAVLHEPQRHVVGRALDRRRRRGRRRAGRRDRRRRGRLAWTPPSARHRSLPSPLAAAAGRRAAPRPRPPRPPRSGSQRTFSRLATTRSSTTPRLLVARRRGCSVTPELDVAGRRPTASRACRRTARTDACRRRPAGCTARRPPATAAGGGPAHSWTMILPRFAFVSPLKETKLPSADTSRHAQRLAASGRLLVAVASRLVVRLRATLVVVEDACASGTCPANWCCRAAATRRSACTSTLSTSENSVIV